jgi:hypothetical protein
MAMGYFKALGTEVLAKITVELLLAGIGAVTVAVGGFAHFSRVVRYTLIGTGCCVVALGLLVLFLRRRRREMTVMEDKKDQADHALREIEVEGGGIGERIKSSGPGTAVDVRAPLGQTAERITVRGGGVGSDITQTGPGTAKRVQATNATASVSRVIVDRPVKYAGGLVGGIVLTQCRGCGAQLEIAHAVHGVAGDELPGTRVECPHCGWTGTV